MRLTCLTLVAMMMAVPAAAEFTTIHAGDAWDVKIGVFDYGMACSASTINDAGHVLDLSAHDDGQLMLSILFEDEASIPDPFVADAVLEVGRHRWTLHDTEFAQGGAWFLFDSRSFTEFLRDLTNERVVTFMRLDDSERHFTDWSVDGTYEAMEALATCFARITD